MSLGNFSHELSNAKEMLDKHHIGQDTVIRKRAHVVTETPWFLYEVWIRDDSTVIVHLKDLKKQFQHKRAMDFLAQFIVNRIGAHESAYADWVGNIIEGEKKKATQLNSLDIFINGYVPAQMLDDNAIIKQFQQIGERLKEYLGVNAGSLT